MKKLFGRKKKKSASEAGSIASGLSGSGYNISPKKDLGKLHKAAFDGDLTKLKSLLKRGDVNQLDKENRTPLHIACASGKYEAVRMLTEHHNMNLNLCDNDRRSALMKCVQCEHQSCLAILLDKGADVSLSDVNGNTALHIAASIPNKDICYLLCDYSADPRAKNKDGATPLHIAAGLGSDDLVGYFLDARVDVNDRDNFGKTPLMYSANKGHLSTVKLLLNKDANAAIRDGKGWTADDHASMNGFHPVSHVIVEHSTKRGASTPSRQSVHTRTPQTTPQRLGVGGSFTPENAYGDPVFDGDDNFSQSGDSFTESKRSNGKDSWASSDSEEDIKPQTTKSKATPKINLVEMMNLKKKQPVALTQPVAVGAEGTQAAQSPSRATTNLFLTTSARQQLEKQQDSNSGYETIEFPTDRGMRERYDSKSARGLPVSPTKPPLPQPRSSTSLNEQTPESKYSPGDTKKQGADEGSSWDDTDEEEKSEPKYAVPMKKKSGEKSFNKPDKSIMDQLGFDDSDMKDMYSDGDESNTATENSRAEKPPKTSPAKSVPLKAGPVAGGDDSWDDEDDSDLEPQPKNTKPGGINFMQKSAALKFDDETDSEPEFGKTPPVPLSRTNVQRHAVDENDDDSSSWNSENLIQRPEDAPKTQSYVSSSPAVLKDAEHLVSPEHRIAVQQNNREEVTTGQRSGGLQNKMSDLGIIYGQPSDSEESDIESESSWEREKISKKTHPLNNQKDVEREERARREEEIRKEEERRRMEEEEKRKKQEEEKREEERRKKEREEEQRREREMQELEKLNRMNEELERKNAELKKKMQDEERRKKEEEKEAMMSLKTTPMNESLRNALERAVEVTTDSGDSNADSISMEEDKMKSGQNRPEQADFTKNSFDAPVKAAVVEGAPSPVSGTFRGSRPGQKVGKSNKLDLDTLTETETEDELSLSENHVPATLHKSPLSDSLKLMEEKQSLSLQLAREQDAVVDAHDKVLKLQSEVKQLKLKEHALNDEKKEWELLRVELDAEKRKMSFEVKNLQENLETVKKKLTLQDERCKRMEDQLQMERDEKKEQEILIRDLRTDLKNATMNAKQLELDRDEMKQKLANEQERKSLAEKMDTDSFKLNQFLKEETSRDQKVESLQQELREKEEELIKLRADRDRYEDASMRYKDALDKLRSQDADQHSSLAALNQELNEKLDEAEDQRRETEEALQMTALQIAEYKRTHEKSLAQIAEENRQKESLMRDLEMLNNQQTQLKQEVEISRSNLLREQETVRKMEESNEKLREREVDLQKRLLEAETKASRTENDAQVAISTNKQRAEELAKRETECEKMRADLRENEKELSKFQRENVEQAGEIKALKFELHQRESECAAMRQEKEDLRSKSTLSVTEQQERFNTRLSELQHQHENERVAFETRNTQLVEQVEHWKSEAERIQREKARKDEELAQAQQDRIEVHKKLGYADAFSKSASKEQQQLMEENTKMKEDNIRLQSQVSLLEQKLNEKSTTVSELQREVDRFYQETTNASRQIDSLNESQRMTESNRVRIEQQLKDVELENIRLKSELESANSWKERLQQGREEEAHSRAVLEEKVSSLECDKLLIEEKMATEASTAKMLRAEVESHRNMWETEVKARSKANVDLSKAEKDLEEERNRAEALKAKLARALEERKVFKTKYEQVRKEKLDSDKRADSYRSAMHDADRRVASFESDCESQISQLDRSHDEERARLEATINRLREQVAELAQQVKDKDQKHEYGNLLHSSPIRSDELKRSQWENEKLKEELRRFRAHVEGNYVDRSEVEAARQEERIKAQAALTPTLDQVNSYLKDRQLAQEVVDQLRQKNEEHRYMQAMRKISSLEEELAMSRRKNDADMSRNFHQREAEISHLYENARKQNDVLQLQLTRTKEKADEYKANLVKERKRFQNLFSSTLGGSFLPNGGADITQMSVSNGLGLAPKMTGITSTPLPMRPFSSTPKKDPSDPLLTQLRSKLDVSIAQHLAGTYPPGSNFNGQAGAMSSGSSAGTPRSDPSHPQLSVDEAAGSGRHKAASNEYMSFLLT